MVCKEHPTPIYNSLTLDNRVLGPRPSGLTGTTLEVPILVVVPNNTRQGFRHTFSFYSYLKKPF